MKQPSKWLIFGAVALAQIMVVLDTSIVNVAFPSIQRSLHFTLESLQWVVTAYTITFGGFLLLGGKAADQLGRRRTLIIGMAGFTLSSFLIGVSGSATMLIVFRALQGLSAAFMSPAALSIVLATFTGHKERHQALAYWAAVAPIGGTIAGLVGGVLTQYAGWRWDFLINVPIGIAALIAIPRLVPKHENESRETSVDISGAVLVTVGVMTIVYGLSQATTWGWGSLNFLGVLGVGLVLLAGFVYNESRVKHPLIPLSIFKVRNVSGANLTMALVYGGMLGMTLMLSLFIQTILHYSPTMTGVAFLPFPLLVAATSTQMPKILAKFGFKVPLLVGPLLIAISVLLMAHHLTVDAKYFWDIVPTLILFPIGVGLTYMPVYTAASSGVSPQQAGVASGLINTSQQLGGSVGLAVLSSIAATTAASSSQALGMLESAVRGYGHALMAGICFMVLAWLTVVFILKPSHVQPAKSGS